MKERPTWSAIAGGLFGLARSGGAWFPVTWEMLEEDARGVLGHIRNTLRTHDPRLTGRGFTAGQLGLPEHYLIRPSPQFTEPLTSTEPALVVEPTPRRPTFRFSDDEINDGLPGPASQ